MAHDRGLLDVQDPFEAAIRFIAVLKEYFLWPHLLGRSAPAGAEKRGGIIDEVVDEFLRSHAVAVSAFAGSADQRRT